MSDLVEIARELRTYAGPVQHGALAQTLHEWAARIDAALLANHMPDAGEMDMPTNPQKVDTSGATCTRDTEPAATICAHITQLTEQALRDARSHEEAINTIQALQARCEAAEADARRWRFCCERGVFPVMNQSGDSWAMFVAVTSNRRSAYHGDTPVAAIDTAIAATRPDGQGVGL